MDELNQLKSLQKLKCKLGNVLEIIYDSRREIRGELLFHYSIIYYTIIASIRVPNSEPLRGTRQEHNNRYRRRQIIEEREEAREWLMSDGPDFHWLECTYEDWSPVRDQVQRLWHDINDLIGYYRHPKYATKLSRELRRQLQTVGVK